MKNIQNSPQKLITNKLLAIACFSAALGLVACQPEGSAEKAGQKIDKAVENAEQKIDLTTEKAGQKMDAAKYSVEQQAEKTSVYIDKSAEASSHALENAGQKIDQAIINTEKRLADTKELVVDTSKASGEYIDDSVITTNIKATMLNDDFLKHAPIEVTTVNGVVKLSGVVDSEQIVGRAIGLANSQEHVKSVQNELKVKAILPSKQ